MARSYKSWNPADDRKLYPFLGNHSPKRLGGRRSSANFTGGLKSVRSYAMGRGADISGLSRASRRPLSKLRPRSFFGREQNNLNMQRDFERERRDIKTGKRLPAVSQRMTYSGRKILPTPYHAGYQIRRQPHKLGPWGSFLRYAMGSNALPRKKQPNWLLRYRSRQRPRTH